MHLLGLTHWMQDVEGIKAELRYFRNVVRHETDFIMLKNSKPWMAIELKSEDRPLESGIRYLLDRTKIPFAFQVSLTGNKDYVAGTINSRHIRLIPIDRFPMQLP